jgi:hypothetical protein
MDRAPNPSWAQLPPVGMNYMIEVYKNNELVETLRLAGEGVAEPKPSYLFGRHPVCNTGRERFRGFT